jgi:ABC-type antimicrobial peptide transport system permease subunit
LIKSDLSRSKGRLAVVGAGVAAGVAVVVLLGSIGVGIYRGVVEPLLPRLPLDLLKVEPRTVSIGMIAFDASQLSGGLDSRALERLKEIEGVAAVYPIVGAGFPMRAEGGDAFFGHRMRTDIFATGLSAELVKADVAKGYTFADPGPSGRKVPVLVARRLLDLYNSTVASAIEKPRLSEEAVIGFAFELTLGTSYARGTPDAARVRSVVAEIVGFSDHANLVGITVPEETLRRWNTEFGKAESPVTGAFVKTGEPADAGPVAAAIERAGLEVDDTLKIVSAVIAIAGLIFALFTGALLSLAAFAIAQTFFLLVGERRTELAILRAMGAKRRDLRRLVLAEATAVGVLAGIAGVLIGAAAALVLDALVMSALPDVPFRPEHIVALDPRVLGIAWILGVLAAILGALVPAARAASANPATALRT